MNHGDQSGRALRAYWDAQAAAFDDEPDHGMRDPAVRDAWQEQLVPLLPPPPAAILDIGCGTGTLAVLLGGLGYRVTGADLSPAMIARAKRKAAAAGLRLTFLLMNAAEPAFCPRHFDAILCRHVLWALPDPAEALRRWSGTLKPSGQLLLIEGYWHTGGGMRAAEIAAALPGSFTHVTTIKLSARSDLWGGDVTDERYLVSADLGPE